MMKSLSRSAGAVISAERDAAPLSLSLSLSHTHTHTNTLSLSLTLILGRRNRPCGA